MTTAIALVSGAIAIAALVLGFGVLSTAAKCRAQARGLAARGSPGGSPRGARAGRREP